MGAGVGGLAAAHRLAQSGYRVTIFERHDRVGGISRGGTDAKGEPVEYCWHTFARGYGNVFDLMDDIPAVNGGSLLDHLIPMKTYAYAGENDTLVKEGGETFFGRPSLWRALEAFKRFSVPLTPRDMLWGAAMFFFLESACQERREDYDQIRWRTLTTGLSPALRRWVDNLPPAVAGMDFERQSAHAVMQLLTRAQPSQRLLERLGLGETGGEFLSLDGPLQSHMFEPWQAYLESLGVEFELSCPVEAIVCEGGAVREVHVRTEQGVRTICADHYVNALSVEVVADLLQGADELAAQMRELARRTFQTQFQVLYRLASPVQADPGTLLIGVNAPWCPLVRVESTCWPPSVVSPSGQYGEVLSAGVGNIQAPGILYDKPTRTCTREEIVAEVWAQIQSAGGIAGGFRTRDGRTLAEQSYTDAHIWHSFDYDPALGKFTTWEPKTSDSVGALEVRPQTRSSLANLVHAAAYVRTEGSTNNLDGASEAGLRAANAIRFGDPSRGIPKTPEPRPLGRILRKIDRVLHQFGIRNPAELVWNARPETFPVRDTTTEAAVEA